jgi:diphthamide synthase (EF-2-diphthine--ammonia ligase)
MSKVSRILLSWSSGKDSAWALYRLQQSSKHELAGLITTFNYAADRVAMHAVRRMLVRQQADVCTVTKRCTRRDH